MKTINLKKYYYPICKKDTFVEVPDEVADAIVEESRAENANDAKQLSRQERDKSHDREPDR